MNTLSDYHKKVLGISLNGKEPTQTIVGPFCFLCKKDDFEENKDLVLKILSAANSNQDIVVFEESHTGGFEEVFAFDFKKEKALNFKSFSEISKKPELKKNLWNALKKRVETS